MRGIKGERTRLALAGLATAAATLGGITSPAAASTAHVAETANGVDKAACPPIEFKGKPILEGVPKHPSYASTKLVDAAIKQARPLGKGLVKVWFDLDGKLWTSFPSTLTQGTEATLFAKGRNKFDGKKYDKPTPWSKVRIHETEGLTFCAQIKGQVTVYKKLRPVVKNFVWQSEAMTFKRGERIGGLPYPPGLLSNTQHHGVFEVVARSESGKHPHEGKGVKSVSFRWKKLFIGDENGYEVFDANAVKPLTIKNASLDGNDVNFEFAPWSDHQSSHEIEITPLIADSGRSLETKDSLNLA